MSEASQPAAASNTNLSMGTVEWAMLLLLSVLWGGSFFFVGVAVRDLPTLTIVVLRVGLAAFVLWGVVALLQRPLPRDPHAWIAFLGMGILNNVIPFGLIVWGQQTITSGLASILNATTPLFTVAVAGLLLSDERINGRKLAGIAVGFAGVVVMIGPGALSGLGTNVLAQLACLGSAVSYAFAGVFGRRFKRLAVDPIVVAAGQVTASSLVLAPLALIVDRPWILQMPQITTWAAIAGLAILSTALAYILYFQILQRAGATNLLLVTFLIPVSAITLGMLVLGEHLDSAQIAGMGLIGLGLLAIDGKALNLWKYGGARASGR
ncbi:DMT family transporter [Methyloligella solikamskensis]|uniref:DMT family transporter n=1 Tax=Methyloligella solikamskensis TaxID=1177756 RepID=A0ABW3JC16_9HYPH